MFKAIGQLFKAIFAVAFAAEELALAGSAVATTAKEEAEGLRDSMRVERTARIAELTSSLRVKPAEEASS